MLKKLALYCTLLLVSATVSAAAPESFIPANSPHVLRLNINRIVQLPWVRNMLGSADEKCREFFLLIDELKKFNIQPEQFFAGEVWATQIGNNEKNFVILIKTALPEAKFAEFFNSQKNQNKNLELAVSKLEGRTIYTAKYASTYKAAGQTPVLATYMAGDVIALLPFSGESAAHINMLKADNNNELVKAVDRKKLCAMLSQAAKPKAKIRSINATAELAGAEMRDITLHAAISYKNAKTAMRKAMEMQFILPSFAGLLFGNDPQLMEEIIRALQIVPDKEKITLSFTLTKSVQDKISSYLSNPANVPSLNINPEDLSNFGQP